MADRMWAAQRHESKQKDGKVSSKYESVSFDDEGNYLKDVDDNGKVTTEFKKLGVPIQSGKELQAKEDAKGHKRGGKIKSASARADGCCVRGKTRA